MSTYCIYQFGLAGELIATADVDCASDDCAMAEMASTRHAAPALELWHGERLLMRTGDSPWAAAVTRRPSDPSGAPAWAGLDPRPATEENSPADDPSITMFAHVVGLLPRGGRRVRLANNHELDVLGVTEGRLDVSLIGDVVAVTLPPGQLRGWRLA